MGQYNILLYENQKIIKKEAYEIKSKGFQQKVNRIIQKPNKKM